MKWNSPTLIVSLLFTSNSLAQFEGSDLESIFDIKVSVASLFEDKEIDIGSSVELIQEEDWRDTGARETYDALKYTTGIKVEPSNRSIKAPAFRGISGTENFKGVYVSLDGAPLNQFFTAGSTGILPLIDLNALEAIEVVKGPGSSIYGADAYNAIVALKTWSPDKEIWQPTLEFGNREYLKVNIRQSHKLYNNFRFTTSWGYDWLGDRDREWNYTNNTTGVRTETKIRDAYRNLTLLNKIDYKDFNFTYIFNDFSQWDSSANGPSALAQNGRLSNKFSDSQIFRASYRKDIFEKYDYKVSTFWTGSDIKLQESRSAGSVSGTFAQPVDHNTYRYGLDFLFRKPFGNSPLRFSTGYNYNKIKTKEINTGLTLPGSVDPLTSDKVRNIHGIFFQSDYKVIPKKLKATVGMRYDDYSDFGDHFSPRASLIYYTSKNSSLKLNYGHAFRPPSIVEQNGITSFNVTGLGNELQPSTVNTYEISWMISTKNMKFKTTVYQNDFEDEIVFDSTNSRFQNAGNSSSKGFELEGKLKWNSWDSTLNYSLARGKQTEPAPQVEPYTAFPRHIINFIIKKTLLNEKLKLTLANQFYIKHKTRSPTNTSFKFVNATDLPTYWVTDFNINYDTTFFDQDLELYTSINDLFNRKNTMSLGKPLESGLVDEGFSIKVGARISI